MTCYISPCLRFEAWYNYSLETNQPTLLNLPAVLEKSRSLKNMSPCLFTSDELVHQLQVPSQGLRARYKQFQVFGAITP